MNVVDLSQVLMEEVVILDAEPFADKNALFDFLSTKLMDAGIVKDSAKFHEALDARENIGSTYMGNLIALPHGKSDTVVKPGVAFCRCKTSFKYQSFGEVGDVRYIFVLAISEGQSAEEYLRVLATLAGLLAHDEFIDILESSVNYNDLVKAIKELQSKMAD